MQVNSLENLDVKGKVVLCRVDLNVPMNHGKITDFTRIKRIIPTIQKLQDSGAKIVLLSHFGRPKGKFNLEMSLAPIVDAVAKELGSEVKFAVDCIGTPAKEAVDQLGEGEVVIFENLRFHEGEEKNLPEFVNELASIGQAFVNDTFSCSHRKHASIVGLPEELPSAAGLLMQEEIESLAKIFTTPEKPMAAVVGGSKVSTKLNLLKSLITQSDLLLIGGAMANTFIKAKGYDIGASMHEEELVDTAKEVMLEAEKLGCKILLPVDVIVAKEVKPHTQCHVTDISKVSGDQMILDFGPKTISAAYEHLKGFKTLVWNGPLGVFECSPFDVGTISLARVVAGYSDDDGLISVAGGGDVVSALGHAGLTGSFSYISTAGGAFLDWLEKHSLPGIEQLKTTL